MVQFPVERIVRYNNASINTDGEFVLYWMTAFRRAHWNFSLERAAGWAQELRKPLVVLEALRCDYPWASDRLHSFILDGMRDNQSDFKDTAALYFPFVERFKNEGKGLITELASRSCIIITDEYPSFFLPRMTRAAAKDLAIRMEAVDSNGLLPMAITNRVFLTAYSFRRFLQQQLPRLLDQFPKRNPLSNTSIPILKKLPAEISRKWPMAPREIINVSPGSLRHLPIDHSVKPVETRGGSGAARIMLLEFLQKKLHRYHSDRNHPDGDATSGLSSYLHFGQISAHEIFSELKEVEQWSSERLFPKASGQREGWWGMSKGGEAFLDQLVTWREIGFNMCSKRDDYDQFDSLPDWAQNALATHQNDHRQYLYSLEEFESAETHDPLWNAAQRQLLIDGGIHNYLRMLWGKKILEWTSSPRKALEIMTELNNKYALDGRDPNSYTGIFWVLGRYDRPFGPARPVFGTIRYMSSSSTMRRIKLAEYMRRMVPVPGT
ncbi:MAG: deoxyribodipyrimidine photolyase [Syntrophobacteraceae bacterium]|jgi:deoxyribodipyrimidine photo-lyase